MMDHWLARREIAREHYYPENHQKPSSFFANHSNVNPFSRRIFLHASTTWGS